MSQKTSNVRLDLNTPFTIARTPNGGFLVEQRVGPHPFAAPGSEAPRPQLVAAFTDASDLLFSLNELLNPAPPESSVVVEEPPFVATNDHDEWMPMHTAPRTGVFVRVEDENGARYQPLKYNPGGWWDAPNGEVRIADPNNASEHATGVVRAAKWRPLSAEEDQKFNGRKRSAVKSASPSPAWAQ